MPNFDGKFSLVSSSQNFSCVTCCDTLWSCDLVQVVWVMHHVDSFDEHSKINVKANCYWITSRNDLEYQIVSKLYYFGRYISLIMIKHGNYMGCLHQTWGGPLSPNLSYVSKSYFDPNLEVREHLGIRNCHQCRHPILEGWEVIVHLQPLYCILELHNSLGLPWL